MTPTDVDDAIREAFELRTHRPAGPTVDVDAPPAAAERRDHPRGHGPRVLVACLALVAVVVGAALIVTRQGGEGLEGGLAVTADGTSEIEQFEPDISELPFPKYYPDGFGTSVGVGAILQPGQPDRQNLNVALYGIAGRWWDPDAGPALSHVQSRMTWAVPSQGGTPDMAGMNPGFRHREIEVDGFLLHAATDDPEVTDEQLQAMIDRMAAQLYEARGITPPDQDGPPARLTPLPSELPELPPTSVLEQQFRDTPEHDLDWFAPVRRNAEGRLAAQPEGHILQDRDRNAFPVFELDGRLKGIYVAGLGLVPRDIYESPGFDPEQATGDGH